LQAWRNDNFISEGRVIPDMISDMHREANGLSSNEGVWVTILGSNQGYLGRRLIRFERNVCYVEKPGKNIFEVKPKKLQRTDSVTLIAETGFWQYGKVSMRFDSEVDADTVEQKLRLQVPKQLK